MTNQELEIRLQNLIENERQVTNEILSLINLADVRNLYLERGYPSLFDWLTRQYGYSSSAAHRRIQAARLLKSNPEVAEKLTKGEVNLSTLAKTQSAISYNEKFLGQKLSVEERAEVVGKIGNKSTQEVEKTLLRIFPEWAHKVEQDRKTIISPDSTRLAITLSDEAITDLENIKDLLSHSLPHATFAQVISHLAKEYLKRKNPTKHQTASFNFEDSSKSVTYPTNEYSNKPIAATISAAVRRTVLNRDQHRCTFKDSMTGKICGSTYQLEIDHILPKALGGSNNTSNLRCLCRKHNQLMAERVLGTKIANQWREP